ncbi:hypothetical protein PtA15_4A664 [Puccinia triticina]|uniref:Uncharacterized protein n=1 Tax=Puccinia triticina TaxID=208348 RepID=A0ABY7CJR9_9BASI|nr:uncharacterized protein PtA15_4A664 [Puccinia triticina]WAQ84212.1 hypothetical protein PtA15_4A664 [Puccinia triticina]WAR55038.1 hypothetical protein PtB15_4B657 [Puccinia triticina]
MPPSPRCPTPGQSHRQPGSLPGDHFSPPALSPPGSLPLALLGYLKELTGKTEVPQLKLVQCVGQLEASINASDQDESKWPGKAPHLELEVASFVAPLNPLIGETEQPGTPAPLANLPDDTKRPGAAASQSLLKGLIFLNKECGLEEFGQVHLIRTRLFSLESLNHTNLYILKKVSKRVSQRIQQPAGQLESASSKPAPLMSWPRASSFTTWKEILTYGQTRFSDHIAITQFLHL